MSLLPRPSAARAAATVAAATAPSSSRGFAASSLLLAAAKGKAPKAPAKKKASSFAKKPPAAKSGSGGRASDITLRYAEARPPPDLGDFVRFHPESLIASNVGRPSTFPRQTIEQLRAFGLPRRLSKDLDSPGGPTSVVRQCTLDMAQRLDGIKSGKKAAKWVLAGEKGSGRSTLLLQTASYALESGWIVLYVPHASEWINSSSPYRYSPSTSTFHQPALASKLLGQLLSVNAEALASVTLPKSVKLEDGREVSQGTNLAEVAKLGRSEDVAVGVLDAVIGALAQQSEHPLLVAIDEAQTLFSRSAYRTPDDEPVESYHLSTPLLFLDLIAGRKPFTSGAILTSLSHSVPSYPFTPTLSSALSLPTTQPLTPYTPLEAVHHAHASALEKIDVDGLSTAEATGMFELAARKGWSRATGDEGFIASLIAAGGNTGEFARGLSRTLVATPAEL
ncbi:hypothetical protein JCM24511_02270 [Saitozyma sp. JCM 24511]|nr:hypothetical protein JCM24511_02270 [Saitozyma sp. JCM 24511]